MSYHPQAVPRQDRYRPSVEQYRSYQSDGFLLIRGLMALADVEKLRGWADDLLFSRQEVPGLEAPAEGASLEQLLNRFTRIHQLHKVDATAEWGILHPRVLDVLEALIGPDVYALQSMLFFNPPGRGGQGWHQDSYYITTYPDTLAGVWIPLESADEENGCLWVLPGSHHEPIYPPDGVEAFVHSDGSFSDLFSVQNVSHLDDEVNTLSQVVRKYPPAISIPMEPGDVLFFDGHVLHRSYANRSSDRFRRAFVTHFCNARSWVPWNHGAPYEGDSANAHHLLARGWTHMPFAEPRFGTAVSLGAPCPADQQGGVRMMGGDEGDMIAVTGLSVHEETPVG